MTAQTRQTAANNEFLAQTKKIWNAKIFRKASIILNESGEEAARVYLRKFTTAELGY